MSSNGKTVTKEQEDLINRIFDSGMIGYAYLTPMDGGCRQEFVLSTTPESMSDFLGQHQFDSSEIVITDMMDRLVLNTFGGFINQCPNQQLCREMIKHLAPVQMGEKKAGEPLAVSREAFERYSYLEDQKVTEAELSMM